MLDEMQAIPQPRDQKVPDIRQSEFADIRRYKAEVIRSYPTYRHWRRKKSGRLQMDYQNE